MRSLRAALDVTLVGLAVAILDFRIDGWDLLPDPLGYGVALAGALAAMRHGMPAGWASLAAAGLGVLAVLAVPDLLDPPARGTGLGLAPRPDPLAALRDLSMDVALGALMMALAAVALRTGDAALARDARRLAAAFAVLLVLGLLFDAAWLAAGAEDAWPLGLALALAGLVAFVLALVLLWRGRFLAPPPLPYEAASPANDGA